MTTLRSFTFCVIELERKVIKTKKENALKDRSREVFSVVTSELVYMKTF